LDPGDILIGDDSFSRWAHVTVQGISFAVIVDPLQIVNGKPSHEVAVFLSPVHRPDVVERQQGGPSCCPCVDHSPVAIVYWTIFCHMSSSR
jgi:hypothetical protein